MDGREEKRRERERERERVRFSSSLAIVLSIKCNKRDATCTGINIFLPFFFLYVTGFWLAEFCVCVRERERETERENKRAERVSGGGGGGTRQGEMVKMSVVSGSNGSRSSSE